jgi:ribosomal protein S18 acetylase RimI-like enzyme
MSAESLEKYGTMRLLQQFEVRMPWATRMNISLRSFTPQDQEFVFQLYADTRRQEVSAWGWGQQQQETFLRMQFNAQQRWYDTAYKDATHEIIEGEAGPIGRIMVLRADDHNVLVDIALLADHRGHGIGGKLLRDLLEQSDKDRVPVRLQVLKANPARRLYERLGFVQTGENEMYFQMERRPR